MPPFTSAPLCWAKSCQGCFSCVWASWSPAWAGGCLRSSACSESPPCLGLTAGFWSSHTTVYARHCYAAAACPGCPALWSPWENTQSESFSLSLSTRLCFSFFTCSSCFFCWVCSASASDIIFCSFCCSVFWLSTHCFVSSSWSLISCSSACRKCRKFR